MTPFELFEPRSLAEALALLDPTDTTVRAAGGCTALMLMMKAGVLQPRRLVSLRHIESRYRAIEQNAAGLRIGGQVTLAALEHAAPVRAMLPVVARTLRTLANVRVRNVATLAGHLAHADPHMDLPPVLIALDAAAHVESRDGSRDIALERLFTGYYETALRPDELIGAVTIPAQGARGAAYIKVTARSADDWPALGVAVVVDVADGSARDVRIVIGAAADRPTRLTRAEATLRGARLDDAALRRAADAAAEEVQPIGDARGSAAYKRQLVRVHVRRALAQAAATAQ